MLAAAPAAQLEAIIDQTTVAPSLRSAFLGRAAAVMLAALTATVVTGCDTRGVQPDKPDVVTPPPPDVTPLPVTKGIQPDRPNLVTPPPPDASPPPPRTKGIQPDRPPAPTAGERPDRPAPTAEDAAPPSPTN